MKAYRRKPPYVLAIQWTGDKEALNNWFGQESNLVSRLMWTVDDRPFVRDNDVWHPVLENHWIVWEKGHLGLIPDFWFDREFEEVELPDGA